jgi:hypothetical protein
VSRVLNATENSLNPNFSLLNAEPLMRVITTITEIAPASAEDTAIREQLVAELKRQPWMPVSRIDVTVRNGVVQLSGTIIDERQRQALRVLAENIPGVKKVEDYIVWIDPVSGFYAEASPEEK